MYTHLQNLKCYFVRTPSGHSATTQPTNSPTQGTQKDAKEQRNTNAEEDVFTAYSMQPAPDEAREQPIATDKTGIYR